MIIFTTGYDVGFSLFLRWSRGEERPPNGSLVHLVTKNFTTELLLV